MNNFILELTANIKFDSQVLEGSYAEYDCANLSLNEMKKLLSDIHELVNERINNQPEKKP